MSSGSRMGLELLLDSRLAEAVHMPRSHVEGELRYRSVWRVCGWSVWFLLPTCVREKQRSGGAFAVHRWAGGYALQPRVKESPVLTARGAPDQRFVCG